MKAGRLAEFKADRVASKIGAGKIDSERSIPSSTAAVCLKEKF